MSRQSFHEIRCDTCERGFKFDINSTSPTISSRMFRMRETGWTFGKQDTCDQCNSKKRLLKMAEVAK